MDGALVTENTSGSVCSVFSLDIDPARTAASSNGVSSPQNGASSDDNNSCKICRDPSVDDEIISPCYCTGTMSHVHKRCLEEWLSTSNKSSCEICSYKFDVKRSPKSLKEWLSHRQSRIERRYIGGDIACFIILTPLVGASSYLCGKGAYYYFDMGLVWLSVGLITLSGFLWLIYIFWIAVTVKFHHKMWNEWRRHNQIIHLMSHQLTHQDEDCKENRPSTVPECNQHCV